MYSSYNTVYYTNTTCIVLPVNSSFAQCASLIKPRSKTPMIRLHYNYHINEVKCSRTCMFNQSHSLYHATSCLWPQGRTHTHTHTRTPEGNLSYKPGAHWPSASAPSLKIVSKPQV